ncbi:hypothetical protein SKAU_G00006090 [Synaphobranchus kaupii]|uniref:Uncharacterized protein n=1 Tax=Synaphobranchus kaupii TaxID=118154 RepID=A0A9Q1G951_SYNKA|nr:hypothetical protein SKAU_G00006090 [Synaphobranchus kaupii]
MLKTQRRLGPNRLCARRPSCRGDRGERRRTVACRELPVAPLEATNDTVRRESCDVTHGPGVRPDHVMMCFDLQATGHAWIGFGNTAFSLYRLGAEAGRGLCHAVFRGLEGSQFPLLIMTSSSLNELKMLPGQAALPRSCSF